MKKYIKIAVLFTIFIALISSISFATSFDPKSVDINDINLNSIDNSKIDELKEVLENIDVEELDSSEILNNVDKEDIVSGNVDIDSIDTSAINIDEVIDIYDDLSKIISNEEIANLINDNSKLLVDAGISKEALSVSETMLRTFDSKAVIDIIQNDLDINKIIEMYKNGASLEDIIASVMEDTSITTKINIVLKLLFSNQYFRIVCIIFIFVAIYSIFITGLIFRKARKHSFATLIPIYRDVIHLKLCSFSPWVLLLALIPILGWLILMAIAVISRFELSKNFGHGFFFGLGLLFFPIIFRSIIAFSNNEYIGDLPEEDDE